MMDQDTSILSDHSSNNSCNDIDLRPENQSDIDEDKSDLQEESSDYDSDIQFCPIVFEQADPLCVELNGLIQDGTISRSSIFYKHNFDVVHNFKDPRHQYDSNVIEFHNTVEFLGGRKTANFIRGQGSNYHSDLKNQKINLGGPSRPVRQASKNGYTTSNGVIANLLTTNLLLLKSSKSAKPIIDNHTALVFPACLAMDGTALKPAFEVDDRTKRVVGGMKDYDLGFIKANPTPTQL